MKAIQQIGYGPTEQAVRLVDVDEPAPPGPHQTVIAVEAAPIQPTDLLMIEGTYGHLPPLPHILGVEGVGRVIATGRDVRHVTDGDRVLIPPFTSTWTEQVLTDATWLRPLPDGDVDQLSILGMNSLTAQVMLTEFADLHPGDWVLQNAANSSVGRAVIPIAHARQLRTVNVVRRPESVDELTAAGADVVLLDGPDLPRRVAEATDDADIALAFDGVGGIATDTLRQTITRYGTVVVYSGMSGAPFTVSGPQLLFSGQSIRGFWIYNWLHDRPTHDDLAEVFAELIPLMTSGALTTPVAGTFTLDDYAAALTVAARFDGKAILRPTSTT